MEYPQQQHKTGTGQRAPVSFRDMVEVWEDNVVGGAANPDYSNLLTDSLHAEVAQVSAGEIIRGRQVEAFTSFVVTTRWIPNISFHAKLRIVVLSGEFKDLELFSQKVYVEHQRSRPRLYQIHCRSGDLAGGGSQKVTK